MTHRLRHVEGVEHWDDADDAEPAVTEAVA
jgi:hypothetical protein